MGNSSRNDAILLLTVSYGRGNDPIAKPLSAEEWSRLAKCLRERGMEPEDLLKGGLDHLFSGWRDKGITLDRLKRLLNRGGALALRMAKWEGAGIRAITRSDQEYPTLLKERLRTKSPPVVFVSGDASLLNAHGIAVIGSRNATEEDCKYTSSLAAHAANQGLCIISGGARGVDRSAMLGALENEGQAIGVLSNGLLAESTSVKYRRHIMSGNLTLISPFNPEAGFTVGNAMARNAHIYCLAMAAVVIKCDLGKGGTWSGAIDNLRAGWVPLWVRKSEQKGCGNTELIKRGGRWLPEEFPDWAPLLASHPSEVETELKTGSPSLEGITKEPVVTRNSLDFYELFVTHMELLTSDKPMKAAEIAQALSLRKVQVDDWLRQGVDEKRIEKLSKKILYRFWQGSNMLRSNDESTVS